MKLDDITNFISTLSKDPRVAMGIIVTAVPTIFGAGYVGVTQYNKVSTIIESYEATANTANSANRKVESLTEQVTQQRETIIKLQERLSDALINAREAKILAESATKEARASASATAVQLEVTTQTLRSEMNSIKRATTNRLGQ
jgi:uncharacterized phage infection (PIP) family protein YhgE